MPSSFMSLPFWIPRGLGTVDGIARVCETELIVEFEVKSMLGIGTREVAIPFEEIESVAFKEGFFNRALHFATRRLHPASSIPGSKAGQFALYVSRGHVTKAREVESLLAYGLARRDLHDMTGSLPPRHRDLRAPRDTY